jgi:hypothetical protein
MSFLGKIFGKAASGDDQDGDLPMRNRTFSATQFRENELARAAEARARAQEPQVDAAQVLSPAVNPIAEAFKSEENEAVDPVEPVEVNEPVEAVEADELVEPVEVVEADEQVEAAEAVEPDEPVEAVEPVEFVEAVEADEPVEAFESVESLDAEPFEAVEAGEPAATGEAAPAAAPLPADPMPWDEAVGWLSQRSAETRNFVGTYWNWDYDLRVLHFLAQQPDLDAGVAAHIFWITAACEDYFPFGDDEPDSEISKQIAWLTDFLGRRFAEGAFRPASYGFDDSWDCVRLKKRLAELHADGRLPWSPDDIPTSSTAELMSFDDIPEEERDEVGAFLARFGVY